MSQCFRPCVCRWVIIVSLLFCSQGGLKRGLLVELANNSMAMVIDINEKEVRLDANNMLAGKKLIFELEVIAIETAPPKV